MISRSQSLLPDHRRRSVMTAGPPRGTNSVLIPATFLRELAASGRVAEIPGMATRTKARDFLCCGSDRKPRGGRGQRVRRRPSSLQPLPRRTRSGGRLLPRAAIGGGRESSPGRRLGATPGRRLRRPGHAIGECRRRGQAARTSSGRAQVAAHERGQPREVLAADRVAGPAAARARRSCRRCSPARCSSGPGPGRRGARCGVYSSRRTVSGERRAARMAARAAMTRPRAASAATTPR